MMLTSTPPSDYLNGSGEFIVSVPANRTLTVTDPNGQLLIDTIMMVFTNQVLRNFHRNPF
jgi:hypothetical protein